MQQTIPPARRSFAGLLLGLAKGLLAFAAVLLALIVVVGAAALLAGWTAAAVRHTVPLGSIAAPAPGAPETVWRQVVLWSHHLALPHAGAEAGGDVSSGTGRERMAASDDDTPLREFLERCVVPAGSGPLPFMPPAAQDLQTLGRALYWERVAAAERIEESYATLQFLTWAGILIGLITTVLVGLRGSKLSEGEGFWARSIVILSIAFPAIGTAVAAVGAFYSPREELARASQQLAGLRQVHAQIATEVRAIPCADRDAALKLAAERYPDWLRRWRDAQAVALAATAAAFGEARNAPTGGAQRGGSTAPAPTVPAPEAAPSQ